MSEPVSAGHEAIAKQIEDYQKLRNHIKAIETRHTEELKPWKEGLDFIQATLMKFLETTGSTGVKTKAGTAYLSTRYSASLPDPEAFMQFVIANNLWDLMDRKANNTAVKEYVETHKQLPPGCNLSAITSVGVRKT